MTISFMQREALAAAEAVARQQSATRDPFAALAARLQAQPPARIATVARGSSDHAANYLAYLIMSRTGKLVTSVPMSLVTLQHAPLEADNTLAIAISQSGQGPDVIATMQHFQNNGANTVAFVNTIGSPLAKLVGTAIDLSAGPEQSVAATKSFITSLTASASLVAHWQNDSRLLDGLAALPDAMTAAGGGDWSAAVEQLAPAGRAMIVGRGLGFSIALEAALKCKETSALQAEAFTGAEIVHGPMALIESGYPLLIIATRGPEMAGLVQLADDMRQKGANVMLAAPAEVPSRTLTIPAAPVPELDPVMAVQAFYVMAAGLAAARGLNPDAPSHLIKVTKTH